MDAGRPLRFVSDLYQQKRQDTPSTYQGGHTFLQVFHVLASDMSQDFGAL